MRYNALIYHSFFFPHQRRKIFDAIVARLEKGLPTREDQNKAFSAHGFLSELEAEFLPHRRLSKLRSGKDRLYLHALAVKEELKEALEGERYLEAEVIASLLGILRRVFGQNK